MRPLSESDYSDLIGAPWVRGGDQPKAIDCWGIVQVICGRRGLDVKAPDSIDDHTERQAITPDELPGWTAVKAGQEKPGDVGAYSFEGKCVDHVGVLIHDSLILHARKESGCVALQSRIFQTYFKGWWRPAANESIAIRGHDPVAADNVIGDTQSGVVVVRLYRNIIDSTDFETHVCEWNNGLCFEYLPAEMDMSEVAVSVNGGRLNADSVSTYHPKQGDLITAMTVPGVTGAFLAGAGATVTAGHVIAAFAINLLISVGVGALVRALTAPPQPSTDEEPIDSSPTFSQLGIRNTIAAGGVISIGFGKHRIGGQIIGTYNSITGIVVTAFPASPAQSNPLTGLPWNPINTPSNQYSIDQNTNYANATGGKTGLAMLIAVSEGEIESANGLYGDSDFMGPASLPSGNMLINGNDASDYTGVTMSFRSGTVDQLPIPYFSDTINAIGIERNLKYAQPWTYTTTDGVDAFAIQLYEPTGHFRIAGSQSETRPKHVEYQFKYRPLGQTAWTFDQPVRRKYLNRAAHSWEMRADNLNGGMYEISLERLTLDDDDPAFVLSGDLSEASLATVNAVNEITYKGSAHPGIALVGVTILATDQINGAPTVTSLVEGKKWWVWDGVSETTPNFTFKYTRNPGEILPGLLLNKNFGYGNHIALEDLDLASFKTLADYCDESIDDGRGGTMSRWRLDMVYDQGEKGGDLLDKILTVCRSSLVPIAGKIAVKSHKARTPTHLFTSANVTDVKIGWLDTSDRPTRVSVTFSNEELDYDIDTVSVEDSSVTDGQFINDTVTVIGTTKPARAMRIAQHRLNVAGLRKTLDFSGAIDAVILSPGDVFWFSSHELSTGFVSGRIVSATSVQLVLDQDVTLEASTTYAFKVMVDVAGSIVIETATIFNVSPTTVTAGIPITVSGLSNTPNAGDVYAFGPQSNYIEAFECVACPLNGDLIRQVKAIEYDATTYDDDPGTVPSSTDELFDPRKFPAKVTGVTLTEEPRLRQSGDVDHSINVSWTPSKEFEQAEIYTRNPDTETEWIHAGHGENGRYQLKDYATDSIIEVSVVPVSAAGNSRDPDFGTFAKRYAIGRTTRPTEPTDLTAIGGDGGILLTWTESTDKDLKGYVVKIGSSWAGAVKVLTVPACTDRAILPLSNHWDRSPTATYMVKAINTSGIESSSYASVSFAYTNRNTLIEEADEDGAWASAKTSFTVVSGQLVSEVSKTANYVTAVVNGRDIRDVYLATSQDVTFLDRTAPTWATAVWTWGSQGAKVRTWGNADFSDFPDTREDALKQTWGGAAFAWDSALADGRTWSGLSTANIFDITIKSRTADTTVALAAATATEHEHRITNDRYADATLDVSVPHTDYQVRADRMSLALYEAPPAIRQQYPRMIHVYNSATSGTFTALTKANYNAIAYETGAGADYTLATSTITVEFTPPSGKLEVTHHSTIQIDANSITQSKTEVYHNGVLRNTAKIKSVMANATQHAAGGSNVAILVGVVATDTISIRTTRISGTANLKHVGAGCSLIVKEVIEE